MRAYFSEREAIGDRDTLQRLAVEAGLPAEEVRECSTASATRTRCAPTSARRPRSASAASRSSSSAGKYGVSGAQPSEVLLQALQQAWDEVAGPPVNA